MLSTDFHKEFSSCIISTSEINAIGINLDFNFSQESINNLLKENKEFYWTSNNITSAHFFLKEESSDSYLLEIKAKISLFYPCVRCLNKIEHLLNIDCQMRLLEKEKIVDDSEELNDEIFFSDTSQIGRAHV